MNLYEHCNICSFYTFENNKGVVCGKTKSKPRFEIKCPYFQLVENFSAIWENESMNFEKTKSENSLKINNAKIYLFVGMFIVGLSMYLFQMLWLKGWISYGLILLLSSGIILIGNRIQEIKKLRSKTQLAQQKLKYIEAVIKIYHKDYHLRNSNF